MALASAPAPALLPMPPPSDAAAMAAIATGIAPTAAATSEPRVAQQSKSTGSSSSPRQFSSDIPDPILEEGGPEESGSDSACEPVTPVSGGRHSHDFTSLPLPHDHDTSKRAPLPIPQASAPPREPRFVASPKSSVPDDALPHTPQSQSRRSARGSASSFKRTMSSLFRRSNSAIDKDREYAVVDSASFAASDTPQFSRRSTAHSSQPPSGSGRRFSMNRSSNTTTRSNSPPSPGSLLDMVSSHPSTVTQGSLPTSDDFKKKGRAATGLTLRGRAVNFVGATVGRGRPTRPERRASSFDAADRGRLAAGGPLQVQVQEETFPPERLPWPLPPDAGTGAKARRMSLSLPDDFTIDVAELQSEFEYQHKILGRHGKHLGKGAASKVTLMVRKGSPGELYAVKEFRGKSHRESQAEYEKKIKSEFSIAKSLHHPNIVETIRLCTDHGRWNHVMEYCSEGDLFGLVQKGHLKGEDKRKDRLCLFKQLIQGVGYLHANGIAHRDIKLENLLLTKDSKLKITDFGVSEVFSGTHPGLRESGGQCGQNMGDVRLCSPGICGSEPYIAPEVLAKKHKYDARASDVWSSAIVMIYIAFGGAIWSRAEPGNFHYDKLVKGWQKWNEKHTESDACITETDYPTCLALDVGINPPALRRLLLQMLNPDPSKRISIEGVLNNRWMKNVECCQVESYDDQAHTIDASKKDCCIKNGTKKIFCHNHLPSKTMGSHSLGKMPGNPGY